MQLHSVRHSDPTVRLNCDESHASMSGGNNIRCTADSGPSSMPHLTCYMSTRLPPINLPCTGLRPTRLHTTHIPVICVPHSHGTPEAPRNQSWALQHVTHYGLAAAGCSVSSAGCSSSNRSQRIIFLWALYSAATLAALLRGGCSAAHCPCSCCCSCCCWSGRACGVQPSAARMAEEGSSCGVKLGLPRRSDSRRDGVPMAGVATVSDVKGSRGMEVRAVREVVGNGRGGWERVLVGVGELVAVKGCVEGMRGEDEGVMGGSAVGIDG
jgi:hypothetical protein